MRLRTQLNCGACHGCCHQIVLLMPDDDHSLADPTAPVPMLERRANGACSHLDPVLGCTIYARRPVMCREFHCGEWFKTLDPEMRREIEINGDRADREMLASGQAHAK